MFVADCLQNHTNAKPARCLEATANPETRVDQPLNFVGINAIGTTGGTRRDANGPKSFLQRIRTQEPRYDATACGQPTGC